jgi:hypothetical protein
MWKIVIYLNKSILVNFNDWKIFCETEVHILFWGLQTGTQTVIWIKVPWTICYIIHNQPNLLQSEHNWMHYMDIRHNKQKQPLQWQTHMQIKEWKSKYHHWRLIASTSSFNDQRTKIHHTWRRTRKTINWNVGCFVQCNIIVNSFSIGH